MNYSSDIFMNDLKKTNKDRVIAKKNKKAYSDHDVMDVADEIQVVAENLGNFYEKKDAKGAVEYARKQWIRQQQQNAYDMAKEAAPKALKEILKNWKEEGHI